MQVVVGHVHANETDEAYELLRYLNEPNETHLGQTADGAPARGRAVGEVFAELIVEAIQQSAAGKSGLIVDLEDTVMMIDGIGSDLISDITTNIIRGPLIAYTNEMCTTYGVDMTAFQPRRDQAAWDPIAHEWDFPEVTLPVANGRPLILVPKWIVRRKVDADLYFHDYLQRFIVERERENPNSQFVYLLRQLGFLICRKAIPRAVRGENVRNLLPMGDTTPTLDEVKAMIERLDRADRASLRPWLNAHFDEKGDEQRKVYELPNWLRDMKS